MAATSIHPITSTAGKALAYIVSPEKTDGGLLVDSFMCSTDPYEAASAFEKVKANGTGRTTVLAQHIIQSFAPGDVTEEEAHRIGIELCDRLLKGQYQYVIATHIDKEHCHNHIIFCNTNMRNYLSFEWLENRGGHSWENLRAMSDEICREHGLSVIEEPRKGKGKSHYEWDMNRQGLSWKARLKFAIDRLVKTADDFDDFLKRCRENGILVEYNPDHKIDLKFMLSEQKERNPRAKFTRAKTLGWYYETEQLKNRIAMYKGIMSYVPRTKVIRTSEERFQLSPPFMAWADRQNMKEVSRAINILTKHGIQPEEVRGKAMAMFMQTTTLSDELNSLQTNIEDLMIQLKTVKDYLKLKPILDGMKGLSGKQKAKYQAEHQNELTRFRKAYDTIREWYPTGAVPSADNLKREIDKMTQERSEKNERYKALKSDVNELTYARQVVDQYLANEIEAQEAKRRKDDLE